MVPVQAQKRRVETKAGSRGASRYAAGEPSSWRMVDAPLTDRPFLRRSCETLQQLL
jgi:hypothetical protein